MTEIFTDHAGNNSCTNTKESIRKSVVRELGCVINANLLLPQYGPYKQYAYPLELIDLT